MPSEDLTIHPVYAENLEGEFALINEVVDNYCYIAMDAKFPGIPIGPLGTFRSPADHRYQTLRINVNNLSLNQLNLIFSDAAGNLPASPTDGGRICAWQFNFREFDADADIADPDAIETLRACGVDFVRNREEGIDGRRFGELLMSSGAVLNDSVEWVTFDGGYDIGYLLRILTGRRLPDTQEEFFELVSTFFPTVYDVKHVMPAFCDGLHGGLNEVAELLGMEQVGGCHQVGSDSLLTDRIFREMKERYFDGSVEKYAGSLYGLGLTNSGNI